MLSIYINSDSLYMFSCMAIKCQITQNFFGQKACFHIPDGRSPGPIVIKTFPGFVINYLLQTMELIDNQFCKGFINMDPELFISYDLKMLNQTRVEFRNSKVNFQKEEGSFIPVHLTNDTPRGSIKGGTYMKNLWHKQNFSLHFFFPMPICKV